MNNNEIHELRHQEICDEVHELYLAKNKAYGDSFHQLYADLGIVSAVTQIAHKYNRLKTLARNKDIEKDTCTESITDTLMDLANYCILTVMEIEREQYLVDEISTK